jgi:hypothetical protein
LDNISWNIGGSDNGNSPIQFDADGNIYFSGTSGSNQVLRKVSDGVVTNLINDNITLNDFVVVPNGDVLASGRTTSTSTYWLRRYRASGGLVNLAVNTYTQSMRRFVDGNIYIGFWGPDFYGIKRYSTSTSTIEEKYWISGDLDGSARESFFDVRVFCPMDNQTSYRENDEFCGYYGTQISYTTSVLGQRNMAVVGSSGSKRSLWQYYPTVEKANSTVR